MAHIPRFAVRIYRSVSYKESVKDQPRCGTAFFIIRQDDFRNVKTLSKLILHTKIMRSLKVYTLNIRCTSLAIAWAGTSDLQRWIIAISKIQTYTEPRFSRLHARQWDTCFVFIVGAKHHKPTTDNSLNINESCTIKQLTRLLPIELHACLSSANLRGPLKRKSLFCFFLDITR